MPYRITERARDGAERVILDTPSRDLAVRYYVALIGRDTLTVHTARGAFVEREPVGVVSHALRGYGASFTASAAGFWFRAECYAPVSPPKARSDAPGYPAGLIDLTRLTARDALSIEPGRRYE